MERIDWLSNESVIKGRRALVLTVLDESGMPTEVVEGVENIKRLLKKYEKGRSGSKDQMADRG